MNKAKQTTLFQSWGESSASTSTIGKPHAKKTKPASVRKFPVKIPPSVSTTVVNICDDSNDDAELLAAMEESLRYSNGTFGNNSDVADHGNDNISGILSVHNFQNEFNRSSDETGKQRPSKLCGASVSGASLNNSNVGGMSWNVDSNRFTCVPLSDNINTTALEDLPGFDNEAGHIWIYPTNYPIRDYQYRIVEQAILRNTMVTLPTGLGKTFVAAVVMFNYYRWYPTSKIVFMAPTKPLVAQQIEACHGVTGIPMDDTAEMTGAMQPSERSRAWKEKRLFFLTPQVMVNDLSRGICPAVAVKCLVIDEAHKALGNHAYCQVVRELVKSNTHFRVVALSATPGSDIKAVQQVVNNLLIAHIELRTEESADIVPYTHERRVEKVVIPLGDELMSARTDYLHIMELVVSRLKRVGVLYGFARETQSLSKFLILKARDSFRQNPPQNLPRTQYGAVEGDFALAMSLYHGFELLQLHGLRSLFSFLESLVAGDKGCNRTRSELMRNEDFNKFINSLRSKFQLVKYADPNAILPTQRGASQMAHLAIGHPKMSKLEEIVLEHFVRFQEENQNSKASTRIIIFSQYRDSVNEITEILNQHRPMVKVMSFVGHSTAGKNSKGFSQKDQLKVMHQFREGGYNTLVSTCIGEEGLDIGDVDLIICFDAHKSPIRLVQRMGRTGRKREGRIVMLVTEGKEEQIYNQSECNKRSIHRAILNGSKSLNFYQSSPRMIPCGLNPSCHRMSITVPTYQAQSKSRLATVTASSSIANVQTKHPAIRGRKPAPKDGFLTVEEQRYWSEHFKIDDTNILQLPEPEFLTGKCKLQGVERALRRPDSSRHSPVFSMDKWLPWQSRLQDTHLIGHSQESRNLVELLEFISVQGLTGSDTYDCEMKLFLNEEDIEVAEKQLPKAMRNPFQKVIVAVSKERSDDFGCDDHTKSKKIVKKLSIGNSCVDNLNQLPKESVSPMIHVISHTNDSDDFEMVTNCLPVDSLPVEPSVNFNIGFDDFSFEQDSESASPVKVSESRTENNPALFDARTRCAIVRTPPPIDEVAAALATLEDTGWIPIDVLQLVCKVEQERQLDNYERQRLHKSVTDNSSIVSTCKRSNFELNYKAEDPYQSVVGKKTKISIPKSRNSLLNNWETCSKDVSCEDDEYSLNENNRGVLLEKQPPVSSPVEHTLLVNSLVPLQANSTVHVSTQKTPQMNSSVTVSASSTLQVNSAVPLAARSALQVNSPVHLSAQLSLQGNTSETSNRKYFSGTSPPFDDDFDDLILAEFSTPVSGRRTNVADNSQLTFTQALACVNDSFNISRVNTQGPSSRSVTTIDKVVIEEPQFDLGFDLSDESFDECRDDEEDDDIDIVPPSPEAMALRRSRLSMVHCGGSSQSLKISALPETPVNISLNGTKFNVGNGHQLVSPESVPGTQSFSVSSNNKVTFDISSDEDNDIMVAASAFDVDCHSSTVLPVAVIQPSVRIDVCVISPEEQQQDSKNKNELGVFKTPQRPASEKFGRRPTEVKALFSPNEQSPLIRQKTMKSLQPVSPAEGDDLDSPILRRKTAKVPRPVISEDEKDSPLACSKTMKKLRPVIPEDEKGSHMVQKKASRKLPRDETESRLVPKRTKKCLQSVLPDDDDDDFLCARAVVPRPNNLQIQRKVLRFREKRKENRVKHARGFLDTEAEVSSDGSNVSADEDEVNLDCLEASFIDDETELSQAPKGSKVDIRSVYLQSVRSPGHHRNMLHCVERYRQRHNETTWHDVFSQRDVSDLEDDEDEYVEDSFCIHENEDVSCLTDVTEEVSPCQRGDDSKPMKPRRQVNKVGRNRRRIVQMDDSSTDDDGAHNKTDAEFGSCSRQKNMKNISHSSIEVSENILPASASSVSRLLMVSPPKKASIVLNRVESLQTADMNCDQVTFSLGFDDFDLDTMDTSETQSVCTKQSVDIEKIAPSLDKAVANWSRSVQETDKPVPQHSTTVDAASSSTCLKSNVSSLTDAEQLRQERLRISRLKRDEFKRKLAERTSPQDACQSVSINSDTKEINSGDVSVLSMMNASHSTGENKDVKVCVLVDSRELSGAQEIVSLMRFKHNIEVVVRQLAHCDYIVSNRMAVERKCLSDFINGANKSKIIDRMKQMCSLFDRQCLIIEKDPTKAWEKEASVRSIGDISVASGHATPMSSNSLNQAVLRQLCHQTAASGRVSDFINTYLVETASLLAELGEQESKKNQAIRTNIQLSNAQEQVVKFYCSLPYVSCATALNLLHGFRTIAEFIKSSVEKLASVGRMTRSRAEGLHSYVRHKFNPQMIGSLT